MTAHCTCVEGVALAEKRARQDPGAYLQSYPWECTQLHTGFGNHLRTYTGVILECASEHWIFLYRALYKCGIIIVILVVTCLSLSNQYGT